MVETKFSLIRLLHVCDIQIDANRSVINVHVKNFMPIRILN